MKHSTKSLMIRLIASMVCTGFSFIAIEASFDMKNPLFIASWVFYFSILLFWVRDNSAPKPLLILGTIFGSISVVFSVFIGLLWAFPAIALMIHVIKCSYFPVTARLVGVSE